MSVQTKRVIWRFMLFALFGLLMEVFFGAFGSLSRHNWNMRGGTSPWMMLDYGLLGIVLMPLARPMMRRGIPLVGRAVAYMLLIFFVELVSGWVFDLCGIKVWDYSHLRYNLCGYITLLYTPFWYALGLVVEYLYKKIDAASLLFALGVNADMLEASADRLQTGPTGTA